MRSEFLAIAVFLTIGLVGGVIFNWPNSDSAVTNTESQKLVPAPSALEISPEMKSQFEKFINQGDKYLVVGNQSEAIEYYDAALRAWPRNPKALFRVGLTFYYGGNFEKAAEFLQASLIGWGENETLRIANQLMLVKASSRLESKQQTKDILADLFLTLDGQTLPETIKFSIAYESFIARQRDTTTAYTQIVAPLDQPAFEVCEIEPADLLELINSDAQSNIPFKPLEIETDLQILQQPNDDINLTVVAGKLRSMPVNTLLAQVSEKTGLKIAISPDAQPYLTGQIAKLYSDSISLAVLLDTLLNQLGISWSQVDGTVKLFPTSTLSTNELASKWADETVRLGRYLLIRFNNETCKNAIALTNANMLMFAKEYDTAAAVYEQLLEDSFDELRAKIHYNQGLINKSLTRSDQAIESFLSVVDQSLDPTIKAAAYLHIAQIHLQENHIKPAIIAGGRSLALTQNPMVRSEAALTLARAYLIDRDPASANRFLFEQTEAIKQANREGMASVYSAYARSLASLNPIDQQKAMSALILALAEVPPEQITSSADSLILAEAYEQVALVNQAIQVLGIEIKNENSSWTRQRIFRRSQLQEKIDFRLAVAGYQYLAQDPFDLLGRRALLRLADFELSEKKNPEACIQWCRTLWKFELEELIKTKALNLMGMAYRELGDIDSSIYCFYGMLPNQPTTVASNEDQR